MLQIGQFSKLAKITVKTLRYYDKIGLLKPAEVKPDSSYRYYSEEQLNTARRILEYKAIGLTNAEILSLISRTADERTLLERQREVLTEQSRVITRALERLDGLLGAEIGQSYSVSVKKIESRLVYSCRGFVENEGEIHSFIKRSAEELNRTNPDVRFSEPDYCCVIYPDDGYRESNVFIEYAQSVDRVGTDTENIKFMEIEPITAVCVTHRGEYDTLRNAYAFAVEWAGKNGYAIVGEPRERYVNGAWNRSDPSEWMTELQIPVKETEK